MRNAIPGDVLAGKAMKRANNSRAALNRPVEAGAPSRIEAAAPSVQVQQVQTKANASQSPVPRIGKVFFTLGGANYVCSGNSVTSGNKSTVSTAGHCVNEGPGAFATNSPLSRPTSTAPRRTACGPPRPCTPPPIRPPPRVDMSPSHG